MRIENSYFGGSGKVSSLSFSGGLVGASFNYLEIENSYFGGSGEISSSSEFSSVGALVGKHFHSGNPSTRLTVTNSYWNKGATQNVHGVAQGMKRAQGNAAVSETTNVVMDVSGATGLTLVQLQAITASALAAPSSPSGIGNAWDLGTVNQLPAVKKCVDFMVDDLRNLVVTCGSYGATAPLDKLFKSQRP